MNNYPKSAEQIRTVAEKNIVSYLSEIPSETEPARRLLEQYSGIPPENIDAHILHIVRLLKYNLNNKHKLTPYSLSSGNKPGPSSRTAASDPSPF